VEKGRTVDELGCRVYEVPTDQPEADGTLEWTSTTVVVVEARADRRVLGIGSRADVTRCGGYTSWLKAAALAEAHNLDVSAHCAPNLHAPVAVAVPNLQHIEYFHDHYRLDPLVFDGMCEPVQGALAPNHEVPGHGFVLREAQAEKHRVA
jgi:hypothetical protein